MRQRARALVELPRPTGRPASSRSCSSTSPAWAPSPTRPSRCRPTPPSTSSPACWPRSRPGHHRPALRRRAPTGTSCRAPGRRSWPPRPAPSWPPRPAPSIASSSGAAGWRGGRCPPRARSAPVSTGCGGRCRACGASWCGPASTRSGCAPRPWSRRSAGWAATTSPRPAACSQLVDQPGRAPLRPGHRPPPQRRRLTVRPAARRSARAPAPDPAAVRLSYPLGTLRLMVEVTGAGSPPSEQADAGRAGVAELRAADRLPQPALLRARRARDPRRRVRPARARARRARGSPPRAGAARLAHPAGGRARRRPPSPRSCTGRR